MVASILMVFRAFASAGYRKKYWGAFLLLSFISSPRSTNIDSSSFCTRRIPPPCPPLAEALALQSKSRSMENRSSQPSMAAHVPPLKYNCSASTRLSYIAESRRYSHALCIASFLCGRIIHLFLDYCYLVRVNGAVGVKMSPSVKIQHISHSPWRGCGFISVFCGNADRVMQIPVMQLSAAILVRADYKPF